jgi:glutamine amidotransferase
MGNLFSVKRACESVGIKTMITSNKEDISSADAIILPGVGAFGDAMENLNKYGLTELIIDLSNDGIPMIGICLGMQLFMTESFEFGRHLGLGLIKGKVIRFESPMGSERRLKVPHVGWNRIFEVTKGNAWRETPLEGLKDGAFMYFVHSFHTVLEDESLLLSISKYGNIEFCSSFISNNIFACQFHPERSGAQGLKIYRNIAQFIEENN